MSALDEAWFSSLGAPLGDAERAEISAYLDGLGLRADLPVHGASSWREAADLCRQAAGEWWRAEEAERARLERSARLDPADAAWLQVTAGAATYAAHQQRLARAAGAPDAHPFLRKYALYSGGRWPLGVYGERFAIF